MDLRTRIPDPLHAEAASYARSVGISLNGLLMVALRDYLDSRHGMPRSAAQSPSAPVVVPGAVAELAAPVVLRPPKSPRAPCPCGSGQQWRHCHGREKAAA